MRRSIRASMLGGRRDAVELTPMHYQLAKIVKRDSDPSVQHLAFLVSAYEPRMQYFELFEVPAGPGASLRERERRLD